MSVGILCATITYPTYCFKNSLITMEAVLSGIGIPTKYLQSVPQEKLRVFSESFKDLYSFLLCPDCMFEGQRRNHRFVSVLFEVSDITQH